MFDKLEDLLMHYQEIMNTLSEPDVANDSKRFQKLMKEQAELTPIVELYNEYKKAKESVDDAIAMLDGESDEEMRQMLKEELDENKKKIPELEEKLKILLLPKDPNDDKNVIVEIRAGAGGDEAALFAAEIYRMYIHYAEARHWKTELIEAEETGIGGMKNDRLFQQKEWHQEEGHSFLPKLLLLHRLSGQIVQIHILDHMP